MGGIMKIYVLTREVNEYDQDGEYFVAAYQQLPTPQQLWDVGVPQNRTRHVINGGGRIIKDSYYDQEWWMLREYELGSGEIPDIKDKYHS